MPSPFQLFYCLRYSKIYVSPSGAQIREYVPIPGRFEASVRFTIDSLRYIQSKEQTVNLQDPPED